MLKTTKELMAAAPGDVAFDMHDHYAANLYEHYECVTIDVTHEVLNLLLEMGGVSQPVNKYAYVIDSDSFEDGEIVMLGGIYDDHARLITITT